MTQHVLLSGPPGAGKLTVARELADHWDVRILDNHIAVDAALRLFTFGEPGFAELCQEMREMMLRSSARAGFDVVSTFAYAYGTDDDAIGGLIDASTSHGAEVTVVQLLPDLDEIRRRVVSERRQPTNKISDLDLFERMWHQHDLRTPYPGTDLTIDNTTLTPADVANRIAEHAELTPRVTDAPGTR